MGKEINWMQQGWECPKCGAVMSPTTSCCVNCRGTSLETTVNTKITLPWEELFKYNLTGKTPDAYYEDMQPSSQNSF